MSRVRGNWVDSQARDVPAPAHDIEAGESADEEEKQVARFWAHDPDAMMEMDRQALQEALAGNDEIGKLERQRDADYDGFMRSGGADKLLKLTARR